MRRFPFIDFDPWRSGTARASLSLMGSQSIAALLLITWTGDAVHAVASTTTLRRSSTGSRADRGAGRRSLVAPFRRCCFAFLRCDRFFFAIPVILSGAAGSGGDLYPRASGTPVTSTGWFAQ